MTDAPFLRPGLPFPRAAVRLTYARSGGPGGQNVNKVETKVVARLRLTDVAWGEEELARVRAALATRLRDDELIVTSTRTRSRERNVEDALERMRGLLASALVRRKKRRPTRPTRGSRERRLEGKRIVAERKRRRRRPEE